jgi:hypothetical protein
MGLPDCCRALALSLGNNLEMTYLFSCACVLSQLAKTLGPSYYCLYSLYNKIRDKSKIVSARYRGGGVGSKGGEGGEMTQALYAHINK